MGAKVNVIQETGIFHKLQSIETNEFVSYCITDNLAVVAVCDGSSSALLRSTGARLTAETAVRYTIKNYSYDCFSPDSDFAQDLLNELCGRLKAEAAKYGGRVTAKDMDTTLFLLIADKTNDCFAYISCGSEALFTLDSAASIIHSVVFFQFAVFIYTNQINCIKKSNIIFYSF